jgi:pre-mRNA-processing factor 40
MVKHVIRSYLSFMQHTHASDSDSENRHKRHRKDRDSSRRNGAHELEDGELGEDGEVH